MILLSSFFKSISKVIKMHSYPHLHWIILLPDHKAQARPRCVPACYLLPREPDITPQLSVCCFFGEKGRWDGKGGQS